MMKKSNDHKYAFRHIRLFFMAAFFILCSSLVLTGSTSEARKKSHIMIRNSSRGGNFTKIGALKKYKVTATNSNNTININKYYGSYTITSASTLGKTIFNIKYKLKGSKKWRKYQVRVNVTTRKKYAKYAFKRQNGYRKKHKRKKLIWSDAAYDFARFRLKTSGFDAHRNLQRDARLFFGNYYYTGHIMVGENLIWSTITHGPLKVVRLWRGSERHRNNMLRKEYKCGAMALTKTTWCAIFFENSPKKLNKWYRTHKKTGT